MKFLSILAVVGIWLLPAARAEEWTRTWNVGAQPELRVEAGDASIDVTGGDASSIQARLVTESYKIGYDGVQVIEHHTGDHVDIRIKEPSGNFGNWGRHSIRL